MDWGHDRPTEQRPSDAADASSGAAVAAAIAERPLVERLPTGDFQG